MQRWEGKIAVVTGASAGIGASIAEKLVKHGLRVVGLARRKEKVDELAKKLNVEKDKLISYKADMSNKEDVLEAFKWIKENVGPISILVNNAGISGTSQISNGDIDEWKRIIDTNLFGLAVATRQALESMEENQIDGHIVNINSIAGHSVLSFQHQSLYSASKFGVTAFTETLRRELAMKKSKIRVTSVSPGLVATDIADASGLGKLPMWKDFINTAPILKSEDIAEAVLYVLGAPPHVQIAELTIKPTGEMI